MNTAAEQKELAANTVETFTRISNVAFSGMERLAALNLSTARESFQQGLAASMLMNRAKNGTDQDCEGQDEAQNRRSEAHAEHVAAYVRGIKQIVMDSQSEFAELMGRQLLSFSETGRMGFPGMQLLEKIAQQTNEMTKATVHDVNEMTKASVRNVAEATNDVTDGVDEATDEVAEEADEVIEKTKKAAEKTSQGCKPQKETKDAVRNVTEMTTAGVRNVAEATDEVAGNADDVTEKTKAAEKTSQGHKPQKASKDTEKG